MRRKGFRFPNGIPRTDATQPFTSQVAQEAKTKGTQMFSISRYWKAAVAFVSLVGTTVAAAAADPAIQGIWPSGWAGAFAAAGTALGTALTWLVRNQPTVEEAEELLQRAQSRLS